jgi:hypothetical protein
MANTYPFSIAMEGEKKCIDDIIMAETAGAVVGVAAWAVA